MSLGSLSEPFLNYKRFLASQKHGISDIIITHRQTCVIIGQCERNIVVVIAIFIAIVVDVNGP